MLLDIYQSFMDFLPFEYWEGVLTVIKVLAAVFSIICLGVIIYFLRNSSYFMFHYGYDMKDFLKTGGAASKKVAKQWNAISRRLNSPNDSDWKIAIIEADKFIDEVVRNLGGEGKTLGERLNSLPLGTIVHINEVWEAHKIRNNIVHDPDYRLSQSRAKETIAMYEVVLKEFEVL